MTALAIPPRFAQVPPAPSVEDVGRVEIDARGISWCQTPLHEPCRCPSVEHYATCGSTGCAQVRPRGTG